jgi:DNA-binding NarL/FixJ family response regulator
MIRNLLVSIIPIATCSEHLPICAVFTAREQQVLASLAQGMRLRAIAVQLFVSPKTIETYVRQVREKTGLTHLYEVIVFSVWWTWYAQREVAA